MRLRHVLLPAWTTIKRAPARFRQLPLLRRTLTGIAFLTGTFLCGAAIIAPTLTNNITVDPSTASDLHYALALTDLRPPACGEAGYDVAISKLFSGGVTITGDNGGDLLLADGTTAHINGGSGVDCILSNGTAEINADVNVANPVADVEIASGDVCIGNATTVMYNCGHIVRNP